MVNHLLIKNSYLNALNTMHREYENMHIYPNMHEINSHNEHMPILNMHAFQTSPYKKEKSQLISLELFSHIFIHLDMRINCKINNLYISTNQ